MAAHFCQKKNIFWLALCLAFYAGLSPALVRGPGWPQPAAAALPAAAPSFEEKDVPLPVELAISALGLRSPLLRVGLLEGGELAVPGDPLLVGWYAAWPRPGERGPAILVGHYDSKNGPGVFASLHNLQAGQEIFVLREDGSSAVFGVEGLQVFPQDKFPTQLVYGQTQLPALRLITCAGDFDRRLGRYSHNLVVFASLLRIDPAADYAPRN